MRKCIVFETTDGSIKIVHPAGTRDLEKVAGYILADDVDAVAEFANSRDTTDCQAYLQVRDRSPEIIAGHVAAGEIRELIRYVDAGDLGALFAFVGTEIQEEEEVQMIDFSGLVDYVVERDTGIVAARVQARRAEVTAFVTADDMVGLLEYVETQDLDAVAARAQAAGDGLSDATRRPNQAGDSLPDRRFRNCWRNDGAGFPRVDMPLARVQRLDEIRRERDKRLVAADGPTARAIEQNAPDEGDWKAHKQALRDVPAVVDLESVGTPEDLDTFEPSWPVAP